MRLKNKMKVDVKNLKGEKTEEIELRDDVFAIEPNATVLHQYIRVYENNQRQGTSSTKTRSEVSGGGTKPWRQKGTGRARHGSIRSPIWVGGGVAHGPKPKSWRLSIPKKMKELALKSALSSRMKDGNILIIDDIKMKEPKTKDVAQALKKLKIDGKMTVVWFGECENFVKSAKNLPEVALVNAGSLGAYDVVKTPTIVFIKDAVLNVQERFKK
jgi:large subunit ribosomal protein L4